MNICWETRGKTIIFEEVKLGDCFSYAGNVYIKCRLSDYMIKDWKRSDEPGCALKIATGTIEIFGNYTNVTLLNSELKLSHISDKEDSND